MNKTRINNSVFNFLKLFDFQKVFKFLNYTFFARHKRGAGIHSPFVFAMIANVLNKPVDINDLIEIEAELKNLENDLEDIEIDMEFLYDPHGDI